METPDLQQVFFQHVKSKLAPHLSLVDEVADLLNISNDSAYRRIRGEKAISMEEIGKLASHFKISFDQVLNIKSNDTFIFRGNFITHENIAFENYLMKMQNDFNYLVGFKQKELLYYIKDFPFHNYFAIPELACFKFFIWMKTILNYPQLNGINFSYNKLMKPILESGVEIARSYAKIPGTEIMNLDNINTMLRQIEYYKDARMFQSPEDLEMIYVRLHEMIDHMQEKAEAGVKFLPGQKPNSQSPEYKLYINEFTFGENSFLAIIDGKKVSYLNHNIVNYIATTDEDFTNYHYDFIQGVIKKSLLISGTGEKYRVRFFSLMHEKIEESRKNELKTVGKM